MATLTKGKYKNISGKRFIGGREEHYDSKGEANLARVLETLKQSGYIKDWKRAFKFNLNTPDNETKYRKNVIDFMVTNPDNSLEFWEYKGLMDAQSFVRLKITKTYYPASKIVVVKSGRAKGREQRRIKALEKLGVEVRYTAELFRGYKDIVSDWE
jgi:ribosomal protein S8